MDYLQGQYTLKNGVVLKFNYRFLGRLAMLIQGGLVAALALPAIAILPEIISAAGNIPADEAEAIADGLNLEEVTEIIRLHAHSMGFTMEVLAGLSDPVAEPPKPGPEKPQKPERPPKLPRKPKE